MYQNNPVRVELFSYVNTFVGFLLYVFLTEITLGMITDRIGYHSVLHLPL